MTTTPIPADPTDAATCHAVLASFLAAIDRGQASTALNLFTDEASLDARRRRLHGRDEIQAFLTHRETEHRHTAHLLGNCTTRATSADELELTALLFLHERRPDGCYELHRVLDTTQVFRRSPHGWRIHIRTVQPLHPPIDA